MLTDQQQSYYGDGSNLTGIAAGFTTEAGTASGIVTHVRLSSAVDHKITATGFTTITSSGDVNRGRIAHNSYYKLWYCNCWI